MSTIANMMFNIGRPHLSKFKGMKAGVDTGLEPRGRRILVDSRWYTQVPNRARRLVDRMRALASENKSCRYKVLLKVELIAKALGMLKKAAGTTAIR